MKKVTYLLVLFLSKALLSFSQPGTPDLAFGTNGALVFDNEIRAFAIDGSGRIIIAKSETSSRLIIQRLLPNGDIDLTFGIDGAQHFEHILNEDSIDFQVNAFKMFIDDNSNRIYITGNFIEEPLYDRSFIICLSKDNGAYDTSFNGSGFLLTIDLIVGLKQLSPQSSGKLILLSRNYQLFRIEADGSLDNSFSFDNQPISPFYGESVAYIRINERDEIFMYVWQNSIAKVLPDGELVITDGFGYQYIIVDQANSICDIAFQNDKILVIGSDFGNRMYRYFANGQIDETFNETGEYNFDLSSFGGFNHAKIIVGNNRISVYGLFTNYSYAEFFGYFWFEENGSPIDEVTSALGQAEFYATSAQLSKNDYSLLVLGDSYSNGYHHAFLKFKLKKVHNFTLPPIPILYLSSPPFVLPGYELPGYLSYSISDPGIAQIVGRNLTANKEGSTTITAKLSGDYEFYPMSISRKIEVKKIPPAIITGKEYVAPGSEESF
ncbi:MAG: hypothetical protein ACK4ND_16440, partial [Cytophagaceae bacterium]